MGGGSTKLLNNFVVAPEVSEDKLAKEKIDRVLTSGVLPKKRRLIWEHFDLNKNDNALTMRNLLAGADFIHNGRVANQNTLVAVNPKNPDSVVFATAYLMALSGLSPKSAKLAVERSMEDSGLKFTDQYDGALELLHQTYKPQELRAALFEKTGPYPEPKLVEDVCRIYELAGLIKPTDEQIHLKAPIDETRRMSLFGRQLLELGRKRSKDGTSTEPESPQPAGSSTKEDAESRRRSQLDTITESLKQKAAENASRKISDDLIGSLAQVNQELPPDLPKMLKKIKKRGELIVPLSQYMKPGDDFENLSLTNVEDIQVPGIGSTHGFPPSVPASPAAPVNPPAPSTPNETVGTAGKKPTKGGSIVDNFTGMMNSNVLFDSDTFTDSGSSKFTPAVENGRIPSRERSPSPDRHKWNDEKTKVPTSTAMMETTRRKITIIRAYSREPADCTEAIDEYLNSTTLEERRKHRKPVVIIRAFSKQISVSEE